jgi:ABC-type antimicrobial peptide transport system permease subunit
MYLPFRENSSGAGSLLVKSSAAPERVSRAVQDVVLQLDTNVPVYRSESLSELVARRSSDERTLLRLLAVLAVLAITLAAVGLHAVVAHTVAQRTREIGVRVALGADAARIVRMVVWHAALVGVVGVGLGLAASAALARVLESYLYGVDPLDPLALGGAALFLELVVLAAGALPARSAARVDAVTALRRD